MSALTALVPEQTWAILDECERLQTDRERIARHLTDRLHLLVPTVTSAQRPQVLKVRRDLHNDRLPPPEAVASMEKLLDERDRLLLQNWSESLQAEYRRMASAADVLAAELRAARRGLANIAATETFRRGVQLSGKRLYRSVLHYIDARQGHSAGADSKRMRQIENTIVRYACRMSLRTSPFGSFTEVGAQPWVRAPPGSSPISMSGTRRSVVRLNRGLLSWMLQALQHADGREQVLSVWLDCSVRDRAGFLEGFQRGVDGGPRGYWGERFVRLRRARMIGAVADLLAEGPRRWKEVDALLRAQGVSPGETAAFVNRLAVTGIFHCGLPIPDQTVDLAGAAARHLRAIDSPLASGCAEVFEALRRIEGAFGTATIEAREDMLDGIAREAIRLGEICGVQAPVDVARALVFEDVASDESARSWNPRLLEDNLPQFKRLQRLVAILDEGVLPRLGLYRWFVSACAAGAHRDGDDVLSVYRSFAEQSSEQVTAVMEATGDQCGDEVRALRSRLLALLRNAVDEAREAPVLRLDERYVDRVVRSAPQYLRPAEEVSNRVQLVNDPVAPEIVLNGVAAGHGVFYSRFCDVVEPVDEEAWSLRRAVRDGIAQDNPRQADITASFGLNVNLHPALVPLEVVYPGSIALGTAKTLTLRDLRVEALGSSPELQLIDRRDGQTVNLVPMNFIFPAGAPMLYRFLCAFAPLHHIPGDVWRWLRRGREGLLERYPRLMLGDIVLARRAWWIPVSQLGPLAKSRVGESPRDLLLVDRWRREIGLPQCCFFRVQPLVAQSGANAWPEETRRWAAEARNIRLRKQYIDFRSPLLVRLLVLQALTEPAGDVMFEECLPPVTTYTEYLSSAEELLIELATVAAGGLTTGSS